MHSNCPRHNLQASSMTWCPWPRFCTPLSLSWFYLEFCINMCFSEAVIGVSVKPCIVDVCKIIFKHALWPDALDLDFALQGLCHEFKSSLSLKCVSQKRWLLRMSNLHSNCPLHSLQACTMTGWPRTLENRENGGKKFPAGKNQGIWNFAENQGKIREFQKILSL